jgi:ribose 5-phosphate isomerase A
MTANLDPVIVMKQEVGKAAASRVKSDSIVGLGTGSTTAYAIEYIGKRLKEGEIKNIVGVPTSFQAEVLAKIRHSFNYIRCCRSHRYCH